MEKVTHWVNIGRIIGISPRKFKAIEEKSLKNYEKIQNSLYRTQEEMGKLSQVSLESLTHYSNYITKLQSGLQQQAHFASLHSLKLILSTLQRKLHFEHRQAHLKRLQAACLWVKALLTGMTEGSIGLITSLALLELDRLLDLIQYKRRQDVQRVLNDNI